MTFKELRKMTGLSQDKFANKYGIPSSTLRKWEQGARTPPPYVLRFLEEIVKRSSK